MPLLILLVVTIIATWYTLSDAAKRGMNARGWGIFVLLTSGAGLPIYFLVRKPRMA